MEYIHVRSLGKYHPGYKDRTLQWAKIYINMASGDIDCEMISHETDWARLIKIILLELRAKCPLPNLNSFWKSKGFDLKSRPMSLTMQSLQNFLEIVTETEKSVTPLRREEQEQEQDKEKNKIKNIELVLSHFNTTCLKNLTFTKERARIIQKCLDAGRTVGQINTAIDNFSKDDWADRHKYCDLVYAIGTIKSVDNFDKWFNFQPKEARLA